MTLEVVAGFVVAALVVYALLRQVGENLTKPCPECGQRIKDRAKVCPYCAHRFGATGGAP